MLKTQLQGLKAQVEAKQKDVNRVEGQIGDLERMRKTEIENHTIVEAVRQLIPTSAPPTDFNELIRLVQFIKHKTAAGGLTEALKKVLPPDFIKEEIK